MLYRKQREKSQEISSRKTSFPLFPKTASQFNPSERVRLVLWRNSQIFLFFAVLFHNAKDQVKHHPQQQGSFNSSES